MEVISKYNKLLYKSLRELPNDYKETGKISGSKISKATLGAVLTMLDAGVSKFDDYTLGKFYRGHRLEEDYIKLVWLGGLDNPVDGDWVDTTFGTKICWQYKIENGYRGTTGTIDLVEDLGDSYIIHEIKSATKSAYDNVAQSGMAYWRNKKAFKAGKIPEIPKPEAKRHQAIQPALYSLNDFDKPVSDVLIHYVNADDLRSITFEVNVEDYKEEIDESIDKILEVFAIKQLPKYKARWGWDKGQYNNYNEFENMTSEQILATLRSKYPEAYDKFMMSKVEGNNIIYEKKGE